MKRAVLITFGKDGEIDGVYLSDDHVEVYTAMTAFRDTGVNAQMWTVQNLDELPSTPKRLKGM